MADGPAQPQAQPPTTRKAYRSFWLLVAVAVLATGSLGTALAASPSPLTGTRVAASGLVVIAALSLATRIMIAVERAHRHARSRRA